MPEQTHSIWDVLSREGVLFALPLILLWVVKPHATNDSILNETKPPSK